MTKTSEDAKNRFPLFTRKLQRNESGKLKMKSLTDLCVDSWIRRVYACPFCSVLTVRKKGHPGSNNRYERMFLREQKIIGNVERLKYLIRWHYIEESRVIHPRYWQQGITKNFATTKRKHRKKEII